MKAAITICSAILMNLIMWPAYSAQNNTAASCVKITHPGKAGAFFKSRMTNTCSRKIWITYDFDKDLDGTPKPGLWCHNGGNSAHTLGAGKSGAIAPFDNGIGYKTHWVACFYDESSNHATPNFPNKTNCRYTCGTPRPATGLKGVPNQWQNYAETQYKCGDHKVTERLACYSGCDKGDKDNRHNCRKSCYEQFPVKWNSDICGKSSAHQETQSGQDDTNEIGRSQ